MSGEGSVSDSDEDPIAARQSVRTLISKATAMIVGQASLFVAVMFYFGWTRNRAVADYLGFAENSLDTSVEKYVLDGVLALFDPLLIATGISLLWRLGDPFLVRFLASPQRGTIRCLSCAALASLGTILPVAAWVATRRSAAWPDPGLSFSVTIGTLLVSYSAYLWLHTHDSVSSVSTGVSAIRPYVLVLIMMLILWATGDFATIEGRGAGVTFTSHLDQQLGVVIFSAENLRIDAPGVYMTKFSSPGEYNFRYEGLKLYADSGGKLFLVPAGWTYAYPQVIVLSATDNMRIEYVGQ